MALLDSLKSIPLISMDWKSRVKNYGFWVSAVSAVLLILTQFGVKVDNNHIMAVVQTVLGVLVLLGIVNNPTTTNKGFGDDAPAIPNGDPVKK